MPAVAALGPALGGGGAVPVSSWVIRASRSASVLMAAIGVAAAQAGPSVTLNRAPASGAVPWLARAARSAASPGRR